VIRFTEALSGSGVAFTPRDVVLAGYTGRDQEAVRRHVAELAQHGVPAPERVPAFYRVTPELVAVTDRITVLGRETSGEGEFILFRAGGTLFVGVASDHTDRAVERDDVAKSKQLCRKVVGGRVWRLDDIGPHWDHVILRSFADGAATPYQEGPVASLLAPEEILRRVEARIGRDLDGVLVFSGTIPLAGELTCASRFRVELVDELHAMRLEADYAIGVSDLLD
jgi:Protein of unknown function (DUF2848)